MLLPKTDRAAGKLALPSIIGPLLTGLFLLTATPSAAAPPPVTPTLEATLSSPSASPFSGFGSSLDVDGDQIVVGAPWESDPTAETLHRGAVYVYGLVFNQFQQTAKLTASDADNGDVFGHAVAIDGDRIVVGAPWESDAAAGELYRGAVYVFEKSLGTWTETARLDAGGVAVPYGAFGHAVAVDNDTIAVGAPGDEDDPGAVFIFEKVGPVGSVWASYRIDGLAAGDRFGSDLVLQNGVLSVAERGGSSWRAFSRGQIGWNEVGQQYDAALGFAGALGGSDIRTAVGAPGDDVTVNGEVHFFSLEAGAWQFEDVETPPSTVPGDRFGAAVALDGRYALIGAPGDDPSSTQDSGSAYLYSRGPGGAWSIESELEGTASAHQRFGAAVAIEGVTLAIGAPGHAGLEAEDGRVFVYRIARMARFTASPRIGCAPLKVDYTDHSVGNVTQRFWDVDGDGTVDYTNPPIPFSHVFSNPGSYTTTLTVEGGGPTPGDGDELTIEVGTGAAAEFTGTPLTGSTPLLVTFTDQSTGPITERRWDLDGDGTVDIAGNQTSVTFEYTAAGSFSPKLEVIGPCGTAVRERVGYVQVSTPPGPVILNPSFEANGTTVLGVGAVSQGNAIDDWSFSNIQRIGRNTQTGGNFYDNGVGQDGSSAAYLRDAILSQSISGFQAGKTYRLVFHVNARAITADPKLIVRLGGVEYINELISPVQAAGQHTLPFRVRWVDVTPGAGTHLLEIEQDQLSFAALLIDAIEIYEAPAPLAIANASFEDNGAGPVFGVGAVSQGNAVSGWTFSSNARGGRNTQTSGAFYDNGLATDGQVVGYLKDATMSQQVSGFQAGQTYRLTIRANGRAITPDPQMIVRLGGVQVMNETVVPLQSAGQYTVPFYTFTADVTPGAGSHLLEIQQTVLQHSALVIDSVEIRAVP
ncbi:MAG: hypothetical protein AAGM22_14415 [Acidobacteriota bacterium]